MIPGPIARYSIIKMLDREWFIAKTNEINDKHTNAMASMRWAKHMSLPRHFQQVWIEHYITIKSEWSRFDAMIRIYDELGPDFDSDEAKYCRSEYAALWHGTNNILDELNVTVFSD
jgi:hypothetical protein